MGSKLHMLRKINDICLFVSDIEKVSDFYMKKLGLELKRKQPGYIEFRFEGTSITLWEKPGMYEAITPGFLGEEGHHFMIAIYVPTPKDVDDLYEQLTSKDVDFISAPATYPWKARAAYFKDPEGNIIELFSWVEEKAPGLV